MGLPLRVSGVVIGRNEGERLARCLRSFPKDVDPIVYVDSGSTDDSVQTAKDLGATVIALDLSKPFTAARARNAGAHAAQDVASADAVMFVDGDCELREEWIETAAQFLHQSPDTAIVCGRLRERFPDRSLYNALCDAEWDTPVGEVKYCGGIAMHRRTAFEEADGFNEALIAGEEPELCVRLRQNGWKIWRLDQEMAWHDAAMTRFAQWWTRARRGGYAFAQGADMHGNAPEFHWVAETRRALIWGFALPAVLLILALFLSPLFWIGFAVFPVQVLRLAWRDRNAKRPVLTAAFMVIGKFAEALGVLEYMLKRRIGLRTKIIEYK